MQAILVFISNMYLYLLSSFLSYSPDTLSTDARKQNSKYDVYIYLMGVATNGGGGISYGATVCNRNNGNDQRISMAMGPMAKDMTADKITDTNANRLKKLASVCHFVESISRHIFTPLSSHD